MKKISLICLLIGLAQFSFAIPKVEREGAQSVNNGESIFHEYFATVSVEKKNEKTELTSKANFHGFLEMIDSKMESLFKRVEFTRVEKLKRIILIEQPQSKSPIFTSVVFLFALSTSMFFASWALQSEGQKKVQTFAGIITLGCFLILLFSNSEADSLMSLVDFEEFYKTHENIIRKALKS